MGQSQVKTSVDLHISCLLLCCPNANRRLVAKLSDEVTSWEAGIKTLKSIRGNLASKKKLIEDKVLEIREINDVLKWIKHDDDREPGQNVIAGRMPSEKQYGDYAQWFLSSPDSPEFQAWTEEIKTPKDNQSSKQALWLTGPYGTGKTTVLYVLFIFCSAPADRMVDI